MGQKDLRWGAYNIGLRGRDVAFIDVDAYPDKNGKMKAGQATLEAAILRLGPLPKTWRNSSREGISGNYAFRVPAGKKPRRLGKHIDIKTYENGYVAAAPSIHPEGRPYKWYDPDGNECDIPWVADLPYLPDEWLTDINDNSDRPLVAAHRGASKGRTRLGSRPAFFIGTDRKWDRNLNFSLIIFAQEMSDFDSGASCKESHHEIARDFIYTATNKAFYGAAGYHDCLK